jgi:DNA-binding NarL/FixJ family response regulator
MPGFDGLQATTEITGTADLASVKVLVLTTFEADEDIMRALRSGASGFLGKGVEPVDLLAAIRTVASGEALLSPAATRALIGRVLQRSHPVGTDRPSGLDALTPREVEVMTLVAYGLSNVDIAERLFITQITVKTHANHAMSKLGVRDRAQLVVVAYRAGLVTPEDTIGHHLESAVHGELDRSA